MAANKCCYEKVMTQDLKQLADAGMSISPLCKQDLKLLQDSSARLAWTWVGDVTPWNKIVVPSG